MGAVAPEEIPGADLLLGAGRQREIRPDPVGVLLEADQLGAAFDPAPAAHENVLQDPLGVVLRKHGEAVRHLRRQRQLHPRLPGAVDVEQLAAHRRRGRQDLPDHPHAVPELQRSGLDAHRLGVRLPCGQPVDDAALHPPAPQLPGRRQPDRPGPHDQHLHVGHGPASCRETHSSPMQHRAGQLSISWGWEGMGACRGACGGDRAGRPRPARGNRPALARARSPPVAVPVRDGSLHRAGARARCMRTCAARASRAPDALGGHPAAGQVIAGPVGVMRLGRERCAPARLIRCAAHRHGRAPTARGQGGQRRRSRALCRGQLGA